MNILFLISFGRWSPLIQVLYYRTEAGDVRVVVVVVVYSNIFGRPGRLWVLQKMEYRNCATSEITSSPSSSSSSSSSPSLTLLFSCSSCSARRNPIAIPPCPVNNTDNRIEAFPKTLGPSFSNASSQSNTKLDYKTTT